MLTLNAHIIQIKEDGMDRAWGNIWVRKDMRTGICWGNMKERDYLKDAGVDGRIILRCVLLRWYARSWTGPIWLRVGTNGGLLRTL